ncbi:MAG: DUF177 domain-containing protein [Hylemonella sp.]|nr:DUF177 domain-containing protein [Hylemonella sp.]
MAQEFHSRRLDIQAFAQAGASLAGHDPLSKYERLLAETGGQGADHPVHWEAHGEFLAHPGAQGQVWLHLSARTSLPMTCQRCLGPADIPVVVERSFRFVASEKQAEVEDEEAEEDVLALVQDFNLQELVEDELLMELPVVPRHELCPTEVKLVVQDADFEAAQAEKPHPFAVLAGLKGGKSG